MLVKAILRQVGAACTDLEADAATVVDRDVPCERGNLTGRIVGLIGQVGHGCIVVGVGIVLEGVATWACGRGQRRGQISLFYFSFLVVLGSIRFNGPHLPGPVTGFGPEMVLPTPFPWSFHHISPLIGLNTFRGLGEYKDPCAAPGLGQHVYNNRSKIVPNIA